MKAAAVQGDYTDIKFIKSRKVAVISVEIAIEHADAFIAAFGTPRPAEGVPVGLARLVAAPEPEPKERRKFHDMPLPQQAALLCDREAFWRFINERHGAGDIDSAELAAEYVRGYCQVKSRADIKPGTEAAKCFYLLQAEFETWFRVPL